VGYDGIDIARASAKGILVTNTPGVLEDSVAEFTVFLAGALLRKVCGLNSTLKRGSWQKETGWELKEKTWAVLGLGAVGTRVARIVSAGFGGRTVGFDVRSRELDGKSCWVEKMTDNFARAVESADIVSLHLPGNQETRHFMNSNRLGLLKPSAVLVNTARGSVVDENALYDALAEGRLLGAGLDVYHCEPYAPLNPEKDLRTLPNVLMTPHVASSTREANQRMAIKVLCNIRNAWAGEYRKMDLVPGSHGRTGKEKNEG
jgi:phosphoglycerate dehydrogenase-like enzyme